MDLRHFPARALAALTVTAAVLACGPNGREIPPATDAPPPSGDASIESVAPLAGAPGTPVTIEADGFAPGTTVDIGFGPPRSEYEVVDGALAESDGGVRAAVEVPGWAERGRRYVFVVADPDDGARAVSGAFHVTTEEGLVRVEGRITDEGVECTAMRAAPDDALYTLAGDTEGLEPGDAVTVEGRLAEVSFCQQGTTLEVVRVDEG